MTASVAALVLLVSGCTALAGQSGGSKAAADPALQSAMAVRTKANVEGDTETIESLMVDEYMQTDIFGRVQNKPEWLAEYFKPLAALIKTGQFRWDIWEEKDLQIRQFGDVSVAVGSFHPKPRLCALPRRGDSCEPESPVLRLGRGLVEACRDHLFVGFNDVPPTDPAYDFIGALGASGITVGCGGGNYCPDAPLTRRQMAVFLAKALGLHDAN